MHDRVLYSVATERGGEFRLGPPQVVLDDPSIVYESGWDVHPDGERFLLMQ